jgi:hypothetical protein
VSCPARPVVPLCCSSSGCPSACSACSSAGCSTCSSTCSSASINFAGSFSGSLGYSCSCKRSCQNTGKLSFLRSALAARPSLQVQAAMCKNCSSSSCIKSCLVSRNSSTPSSCIPAGQCVLAHPSFVECKHSSSVCKQLTSEAFQQTHDSARLRVHTLHFCNDGLHFLHFAILCFHGDIGHCIFLDRFGCMKSVNHTNELVQQGDLAGNDA